MPLKFQQQVLGIIVEHLFDKGVLARKAAASCITTFLSHNCYSANVSKFLKQISGNCFIYCIDLFMTSYTGLLDPFAKCP